MAKPRVTATDRLADVIEVVELGQRTGMLFVERGSGPVLEEGAIYFFSGRVIYAELAGLRGREALATLSRWGDCRFAFDRAAQRPIPNVSGPLPSLDPAHSSPPPTSQPSMSSSRPGQYDYSRSTPRFDESSGAWPLPPEIFGSQPGSSGGANGYSNGADGYPNRGYPRGTGVLGHVGQTGHDAGPVSRSWPSGARAPVGTTPIQPFQSASRTLNRCPRRAPDVRDLMAVVIRHNLSRGHRSILLLADGEHTVLDIARLSSKPIDEVSALLSELEARGLIYYYA